MVNETSAHFQIFKLPHFQINPCISAPSLARRKPVPRKGQPVHRVGVARKIRRRGKGPPERFARPTPGCGACVLCLPAPKRQGRGPQQRRRRTLRHGRQTHFEPNTLVRTGRRVGGGDPVLWRHQTRHRADSYKPTKPVQRTRWPPQKRPASKCRKRSGWFFRFRWKENQFPHQKIPHGSGRSRICGGAAGLPCTSRCPCLPKPRPNWKPCTG